MPGSPRDPRQPYDERWDRYQKGPHSGASYDPYSSADPYASEPGARHSGYGNDDPLLGDRPESDRAERSWPDNQYYGQFYDQERDEPGQTDPAPNRGRHCAPDPADSADVGANAVTADAGSGYAVGPGGYDTDLGEYGLNSGRYDDLTDPLGPSPDAGHGEPSGYAPPAADGGSAGDGGPAAYTASGTGNEWDALSDPSAYPTRSAASTGAGANVGGVDGPTSPPRGDTSPGDHALAAQHLGSPQPTNQPLGSQPPGGSEPRGSEPAVEAYGVDPTAVGGGYVARFETPLPPPSGGGAAGSGDAGGGGSGPPGPPGGGFGPPPDHGPNPEGEPSRHGSASGRRSSRRREPRRSFKQAIGLTVLGGLIPGTGFLAAGRRRLGLIILGVVGVLAVVLLWMATIGRHQVLNVVLDPETLVGLGAVLILVGLAWVSVIVITHRLVRPRELSTLQRFAGSVVVSALALVVLVPMMVASRYAFVSGDTFQTIFAGEDSKSATRPDVTGDDPWGGQRRVNVLLLGGDGGEGREGVRTDSVIVASIDSKTGRTVLLSLPRNLEDLPFPEGKLRQAYPNGFQGKSGLEADSMLNAVYRVVPSENPDILDSDHPGADALKLGVGEALGLRIDYFTLINLNGFEELINALGGITVNVNERVAVGGSDEHGIPPNDYIEPGPNRHLNGDRALWYARGRYGSSDFDRMDRQRCAINAMIARAKPAQVLRRYEAIASSSKNLVETDIPASLLSAFVDLSLQVKNSKVSSMVYNSDVIAPADPDYSEIRQRAQKAIKTAEQDDEKPKNDGSDKGSSDKGSSKKPSDPKPSKSSEQSENNDDSSDSGGSGGSGGSTNDGTDSVEQSCAYNPVE